MFAHCCSVGPHAGRASGGADSGRRRGGGRAEVAVGQFYGPSYTRRLQLETVGDSGADRETALHHVGLFLLAAVAAVGSGGCIPAS